MGRGVPGPMPAWTRTSVWQTPVATMRTSTSPARGSSRSTVSRTGAALPSRDTAAVVFTKRPSIAGRLGERRRARGGRRLLLVELGRLRWRRGRHRPRFHRDLALPRHLVAARPAVHLKVLEEPHTVALHDQVVARADPEYEVRVVVHIVLKDLVEALHARARLTLRRLFRRHQEVVEKMLSPEPPALPLIPQRFEVLENRRMPLHAALPQVIEIGVVCKAGHRARPVGEVDRPRILGEQLEDVEPIFRREFVHTT